jgi:pimeloyl-ACP methyl ester carboxylesterase
MSHLLKYKNTQIFFTDSGRGKTLVLLHGFLESSEIWKDFSKQLSKEFRIITIDLLGHGKTGNIGEIHTMEMMADAVKFVLNNQMIRKCTMIGHSLGGSVTLAFAEMFPNKLNGFGLFHSTAFDDSPEGKINRDKMVEAVNHNHINFIYSFIPNLFPHETVNKFDDKIKLLQVMASSMSTESIVAALLGMKLRKSRIDVLSNATVPVLFIIGKKDTRLPFEKVLPQLAACNNSSITILGNVGHMGYIEAPEETLYAIKSFLKQLR